MPSEIPPNCFIVTQEWLTECFDQHSKLDEKPFVIAQNEKTAPATPKRTSISNATSIEPSPAPPTTTTAPTNERTFLSGLVFYVTHYPSQVAKGIIENIQYCGGKCVDTYSKECTHVLTWHLDFAEHDQVCTLFCNNLY